MHSKKLFGVISLLIVGACTTTNPDSPVRPAVRLEPAKEKLLLDRAAAIIEAKAETYAHGAIRFVSATISEPYPEKPLFRDGEVMVYCVQIVMETVLFQTGARAKISLEDAADGAGKMTVQVSRGTGVDCRDTNPRSFETLIALREARRAREDAARIERQRANAGSPALVH